LKLTFKLKDTIVKFSALSACLLKPARFVICKTENFRKKEENLTSSTTQT